MKKSKIVIPTLESQYQNKEVSLFLEALDTKELQNMKLLLDKFYDLVKGFDLPELKKGIKKANDELVSSISGKLPKLIAAGETIRANPKKLAKAASFQTALIKGLQQLPDMFDLIKRLQDEPKNEDEALQNEVDSVKEGLYDNPPEGWDERFKESEPLNVPKVNDIKQQEIDKKPKINNKTIKNSLTLKQYDRLKGLMLNAFSPPGFLAMFRGMPYVNDSKVVDEILSLKIDKFEELAVRAQNLSPKIPVSRSDLSDIAQSIRNQRNGEKPTQKTIEIEPAEELSIPQKREKQTAQSNRIMTRTVDINEFGTELMNSTDNHPSTKISLEQTKAILKFLHKSGYLNIRR